MLASYLNSLLSWRCSTFYYCRKIFRDICPPTYLTSVELSPVRVIFSVSTAAACVDVNRPNLCRPGGAIGVVRPAYGPANHPRTLSAFNGCGAEIVRYRLLLSFVYIRSLFYNFFQVRKLDIVSVGDHEPTTSNFQKVPHALFVLRRVNRPLRKVWQTFSALKFAGKVGQANSGDEFYDKRRYGDALNGRLWSLWMVFRNYKVEMIETLVI